MAAPLIDSAPSVERYHVSFEDITYSVRQRMCSRVRKEVLKGVSGEFRAGDVSVIVGPSGAGKSSLMDILAGYKSATSGKLLLNGRVRDERFFRQHACYIMQSDVLQPLLTAREALAVAAELKLGRHVGHAQKLNRVEEIILALKLDSRRDVSNVCPADTRTAALSGGQRKRLAVGLELVSDPHIMFLDEPTSGLDSSTSKQMMSLLRELADQGRTLVVTMHQPSTPLLLMMDRLYTVHSGRCAFIGAVSQLVPFLNESGFKCPPYHNPVDFLMEVCLEERPDHESPEPRLHPLVVATQNGKCETWMSPTLQYQERLQIDRNVMRQISAFPVQLTPLPPTQEMIANKFTLRRRYNTSFLKQFSTLFFRSFKTVWRDPSLTRNSILIHCAVALVVGTLCYNIGEDAKYVDNRLNYNALYFSLMFVMYTAFSSVTLRFPCDMPAVRREHFNRWYSTSAYYATTIAASIPTQVVCSLLYSGITYAMLGHPLEVIRFLSFAFVVTLVSLIAMSVGLLVGTIFDIKNGAVFGPFFIMPFVIFSGFFLSYSDARPYARWMFHFSFLNHGIVALCISMFGWRRSTLESCSATHEYCRFQFPYKYLEELKLEDDQFPFAVLSMCVIWMVVAASAYAVLRLRLKYKR